MQDEVVRRIVSACREFDNLYFEVCNEPYFGGVTMDWQNHIVDVIRDAEKDLSPPHLISMNVANGSKKIEKPNPRRFDLQLSLLLSARRGRGEQRAEMRDRRK